MLPFTLLELTTQIKKLSPDKSSGPSGITNRMLQAGDAEFQSLLLLLFMAYGNPMCNLPTGNRFLTLLARWPESAKVLRKMSNGVENLIKNWDDFTQSLKNQ